MKKSKVGAIAVLGLSALIALPSCTAQPSEAPQSDSSTSEEAVAFYNVVVPTNVKGAYVVADKTTAKEGDEVKVTVALTDAANYSLKAVKVGTTVLTGTKDANDANVSTYKFNMPKGNATIAVETEKIVLEGNTITVNAEHATVTGLPVKAKANTKVKFNVFAENGYNVTAVSVKTGETDVEVTGSFAAGFEFVMPNAAVEISLQVVGNIAVLSKDDKKIQVPNNKDEMFDATIADLIDSVEYDDKKVAVKEFNDLFVRSGTEVKLNTKHHLSTVADNFYVNGEKLVADTYTAEEIEAGANESYTFTMPYCDAKITSDQRIKSAKVSLEASDLITASLFTMDEEGNKTPLGDGPVQIQDKVYVTAKLNEGVDAIIDSVFIEYDKYKTDTSIATEKATKLSTKWDNTSESWMESFAFIDADTKGFKLPAVQYASDVKIKFNILTPKYEGTTMCGNFAGTDFFGSSTFSTDNLTIDEYGRISTGTYKGAVILTNEDGSYSCLKGSNTYPVYVKDNVIAFPSTSLGLKDVYAYVHGDYAKGAIAGRAVQVGTQSVCQLFVKASNEIVATFYIDNAANELIFDPEIVMIEGTNFTDSGAKFQVKVNGEFKFMNYIPETSDPIEGLAFVGKKFRVDYMADNGYGDDAPAFIEITINADNTLTFNAENGEGYTIENETTTFVYFAQLKTIYATHSGEKMELYFDDALTSFTAKGKLKGSNYWNKHSLEDKTFTIAAETPAA